MKTKLLVIALLISLCFNLFFAIGFVKARETVRKFRLPEGQAELVARKLNLTNPQRAKFDALKKDMKQKILAFQTRKAERQKAMAAEMARGSVDAGRFQTHVNSSRKDMEELHRMFAEQMMMFIKELTPEQRRLMGDIFNEKKDLMKLLI